MASNAQETELAPGGVFRPLPRVVTMGFALAPLMLGLGAIYGWHTGMTMLIRLYPGYPALSHGCGIGLVIAAVTLGALAQGYSRTATVLGILLGLIGFLGIIDTFGGLTSLEVLRLPQVADPAGTKSGPMGLNSALSLLLAGILSVLLAREPRENRRHFYAWLFGMPIIMVSLVAILGYLSGVTFTYDWSGIAPMAMHGAFAFLALGIGLCLHAWYAEVDWHTLGFILWGVVLPVAVVVAAHALLGQLRSVDEATHATLESLGAIAAVALALLLHTQWRRNPHWESLVPAAALFAVGVVSLIHALVQAETLFVWLYTLTNLTGAAIMVLVWLPARIHRLLHRAALVYILVLAVAVVSLLSLAFPERMPVMQQKGQFTVTADVLNLLAGVLFIVAAARYIQLYRATRADYAYTVALIALVLGASGVLFQASAPWDSAWWSWHGLRFGAFVIGLAYVATEMLRSESDLRAAHEQLQEQLEAVRRANEERDREHSQLLALFDGIEELIYVIDPDSKTLVYVNDAFRHTFGEDVLGKPYREVLYGIGSAAYKGDDSGRFYREGSALRVREVFNTRTGRWYRAATKPILWEDDREMRFEMAVDITDVKRSEEALRKAEEQLRVALDSADMGIWQYDVAEERIHLDEHVRNLFGLRDAQSPMPIEDALSRVRQEDRERIFGELDAAIEERDDTDTQFDVVLESGFIRNLATRGQVYRDESGQAERLVGVCWDQTESMAAERALHESEARLQAVLDNSATLILMKDRTGRYVLANRQLANVLGRETARIVGLTDVDLWPAQVAAAQQDGDALVLSSGEPLRREETIPYPDGDHTVYFVKFPLRGHDGSVYAVAAVGTDITERKRHEDEIARLTERLQIAARSAGIGIWEFDIQHDQLIWDETMYRLYGISAADFDGAYHAWTRGVHPDDLAAADAAVSDALTAEREFDTEFRIVRPDGSVRHIKAYGTVERDQSGQPTRMIGTNWDITQRREAEEGLRESEKHFRTLMEQAADAFFVLDGRGKIVDVNRQACESLGYAYDQIVGMGPWDFDVSFPRARVRDLLAEVALGEPITIEGRHRRTDGTTFPVELRIGCIQVSGKIAYLASARDITERLEAERALRESEERLRTLTNTVPCAIYRCALDADWSMQYMSAQIEEVCGYPPSDFVGNAVRTFASIIHPDDVARVDAGVRAAIDCREPFVLGYRILHAGGSVRWVHEEGRAVFDENGVVGYLDGFILDQTLRIEAEQALHERTRQLQETVAELNRMNQELDQFAYVASHDLQEPLRTLTTYSGFLQEDLADKLTGENREDFRLLMEAAKRMQALVRDLLTFSRSGRTTMEAQKLSLDQCVDDALANLQTLIEESGATIHRQPLPEYEVDRTLMTQVFQNLLNNAMKFRDEEAPVVEITAEHVRDRWVIGVRDNGIGIDPQFAEHIFAPFKRLHSIRDYAGSGIGLAVARRVIERHGGSIWVESAPGKGSHFRFTVGTWKGTTHGNTLQDTRHDSTG